MNYTLEPDPTEAAHDGRCPICGSADIHFEKEIGTYPVNTMWEGKMCQRVKKSFYRCENCMRFFTSNQFFTY